MTTNGIDTKYEDGFKVGVKAGLEEINRVVNKGLDDEDSELEHSPEHVEQQDFDERYPMYLAQSYASREVSGEGLQVIEVAKLKDLVIKPEPEDPARCTYDDGFIDGLCCQLVSNSDILMEDLDTPFADAWKDPGWHKAFARAALRAGYAPGTTYSPDLFRLSRCRDVDITPTWHRELDRS